MRMYIVYCGKSYVRIRKKFFFKIIYICFGQILTCYERILFIQFFIKIKNTETNTTLTHLNTSCLTIIIIMIMIIMIKTIKNKK